MISTWHCWSRQADKAQQSRNGLSEISCRSSAIALCPAAQGADREAVQGGPVRWSWPVRMFELFAPNVVVARSFVAFVPATGLSHRWDLHLQVIARTSPGPASAPGQGSAQGRLRDRRGHRITPVTLSFPWDGMDAGTPRIPRLPRRHRARGGGEGRPGAAGGASQPTKGPGRRQETAGHRPGGSTWEVAGCDYEAGSCG